MKTQKKTNVLRLLDQAHIAYESFAYSVSDGKTDAVSVAEKLNVPVEQVYKTLVTVSDGPAYFVFVIPAAGTLDLKAAARAAGVKSIAMIHVSEILEITGYIRGGCSPIGMKKLYPTSFDCACQNLETVIVSGGKIGYQIEVDPQDLIRLTRGSVAPLTKEGL